MECAEREWTSRAEPRILGSGTMANAAVFRVLASALLALCAACGSSPAPETDGSAGPMVGGQTGGETGLNCTASTKVEPIGMDSSSALGFSAAQVLTGVAGERLLALTWSNGEATRLQLSIAGAGTAGYARACSANEVDVLVTLATSDGALAEQADARLFAHLLGQSSLSIEMPVTSLRGSLSSQLALPAERSTLSIHLDFADDVASGGIDAIDPSATQSAISVATF